MFSVALDKGIVALDKTRSYTKHVSASFNESTQLVDGAVREIEGIAASVGQQRAACCQVSENIERISHMTKARSVAIDWVGDIVMDFVQFSKGMVIQLRKF